MESMKNWWTWAAVGVFYKSIFIQVKYGKETEILNLKSQILNLEY